jgi:hypothetical protein
MGRVQEGKEAKTRVPGRGVHQEVGVKVREQQQERCGTILLAFVGRTKVVEKDDTEAADKVGELERQAAVAVA